MAWRWALTVSCRGRVCVAANVRACPLSVAALVVRADATAARHEAALGRHLACPLPAAQAARPCHGRIRSCAATGLICKCACVRSVCALQFPPAPRLRVVASDAAYHSPASAKDIAANQTARTAATRSPPKTLASNRSRPAKPCAHRPPGARASPSQQIKIHPVAMGTRALE